ncbi:tyrosine-protein phosphatase [Sporolactobacillus shoreae]|uniref:Tyrosine-protein phosphatase n=1 Tax=Sporolactobacillus shoreae TaxID=1465501 RepID=A0A4Z0GQL1_9BACL|nr:tyrosine-protein phosphatase [Sporolactobacillus shoreae]TGA98854.1 tyrosine-protein phosphatase [Sporolactobacillus shoreae]
MEEKVLPERLLPLEGVFNFRDMGGIKAQDGRRIKKGLIFRAAELTGLTAGDIDYLKDLEIKYIYDYRDKEEADLKPDPQIGREKHERVAVNGEDKSTAHSEWDPETFYKTFTREKFTQVYAQMPIRNASYQRMMSLVARPEQNLPLVHHCTGGRDRTGVGAMLILKTLGVPTDTIMEDYMLSNQTLFVFHEEMFEEASHYISGTALKRFEDGFLLHEEFLEAAMQSISETYGTFEHYLSAEFGMTDKTREKIQDFCLE